MRRIQVGERICSGRFEIQALLGSGGSGDVYLARDVTSVAEKQLSLKVYSELASGVDSLLETQARIHRDTEALAKIKSESIVQTSEVVNDFGMTILVQEYLAGGSLQELIQNGSEKCAKSINWLRIALSIAEGLDVVHSAGLIHGDIKPANIGFRDFSRSRAVFLDFGQASLVNSRDFLSRGSQAMGTLPYLAPEHTGFIKSIRAEQADLYSLGATLYELASGKPPFLEESPEALVEKILNGIAIPLSEAVAGFSDILSEIVQKLLRKNPNDRYFSARGLVHDLRRALQLIDESGKVPPFALGKKDKFRELNRKATFVGRQVELEKLKNQLAHTRSGRGGCAFIGAPSGAGKSSLCQQIGLEASEQDMIILMGKFSEFERNLPLSGILYVIHSFLRELTLKSSLEQSFWTKRTAESIGSKLHILTQRLTFLVEIFGPSTSSEIPEFEDEQKAFVEALVELLVQMGSLSSGVVLILDDLQWSDAESMTVVEHISALSRKGELGKLLMLGCYRSNEVDHEHLLHVRVLQYEGQEQHVQLGPLSEEESGRLVEYLLDEESSEVTRLKKMSYLLTQGNPFYLREYLSFCIGREIFRSGDSGEDWIFDDAKAQGDSLSHGIASLVSDRIGELNPDSRQLLLVASAVGNQVPISAIEYILHESQHDSTLLRSLSELSDKHLIRFNRTSLSFVHDKVREAAYQLAGPDLRMDSHHSYAIWLSNKLNDDKVGVNEGNVSNEIFELAYHVKNGRPQQNPSWARTVFLDSGKLALKVFAYKKALEYAQSAYQLLPNDASNNPALSGEYVLVSETLADALVINEDPTGAVEIYSKLINSIDDHIHRSEILAKVCECNLTLFRYPESISAAQQGMKYLNKYLNTNELRGLLGIILMAIPFAIGILLWVLFGKQTQTIDSRRDKVFYKLLVSMQVALFFSRPVCAINNQIVYTFAFLRQKPCEYRAILLGYWAVAAATFGFSRISSPLFRKATLYFEQHPNPIYRSFLLFNEGYLNEFPRAKVRESHAKHVKALEILETAGDSFWRVLTLQGLIQMDEYALGNGESYALHAKYASLILRIKQTPTILDAVLRHHLLTNNLSELSHFESIVKSAAIDSRTDEFDTADRCYANISLGEINLLRDDPAAALPYLKEAFSSISRHFHRIFYCIFAPLLLATCYVRLNRPISALPALLFAWINLLFSARLLLPKTTFITGELLYRSGFRVLGRWIAQRGITKAQQLQLPAVHFELRLYLASLIMDAEPDYACVLFRMCREYFSERQYVFFVDRCDQAIFRIEKAMGLKHEAVGTSGTSRVRSSNMEGVHQKIELESLLQVFLNLSALTDRESLLDATIDAMCSCARVEFAVLFLEVDDSLTPVRTRGCTLNDLGTSLNPSVGVDKYFLNKCFVENRLVPRIRPRAWRTPHPACDGSVMVVPLVFQELFFGFCYLFNPQVNDYFDAHSLQALTSLASQAAIAYQNFILFSSKEEKARLDAEFDAARAVQSALLPEKLHVPSTLVSNYYAPACETGGDWFHHHYDATRNLFFVMIGDVTGHGMTSALLTAVVSGAVLSHLNRGQRNCSGEAVTMEESLKELAAIANNAVLTAGARSNRLMTMSFVCLNLNSGELGLVCAGHPPPYISSRSDSLISSLPCSGALLGFSENPHFGYTSYQLNPGDSVLFYTDGLLENATSTGPLVNQRTLKKIMREAISPQDCVDGLSQTLRSSSPELIFEDDVTIYMFRWEGSHYQKEFSASDMLSAPVCF